MKRSILLLALLACCFLGISQPVSIRVGSPDSVANLNVTTLTIGTVNGLTLPSGSGTNGYSIITDGAGHLSYANVSGGGGSGILSVSGTTNRITVTSGSAPIVDISSTFEALLGKVASPLSQFASTTSSQLSGVISDETGSGSLVFGTSPTLTTPNLGTPSALTLTNATGLSLTTGITGVLPIANGGTNISTYTTGDLPYASATNVISKRSIGSTGQVLTVSGGVPTWATPSAGSTNVNIGSGFRFAVPNTNNIKTASAGYGIIIDSTSNSNSNTYKLDTVTTNRNIYYELPLVADGDTVKSRPHYLAISGNYTALSTDYFISVNNSSSTVTVTLPPPSTVVAGRAFRVKRIDNSSTGTINVTSTGSSDVQRYADGVFAATVTIPAFGASAFWGQTFINTGTKWEVMP